MIAAIVDLDRRGEMRCSESGFERVLRGRITFVVVVGNRTDTIHLVMDNLSSHRRKALVERFGEKIGGWLWNRFTVHYTPKHGSWLDQAEIEISLFSRQCLGQRRIPSLSDLRREAKAWNRKMNRNHVTIDWQFTRRKARKKFGYKRNIFKLSET